MPLRQLSYEELVMPSGNSRAIAGFAVEPEEVERRFGMRFDSLVEPGLGAGRCLRLALPSGSCVFLEWHAHAPVRLLILEADAGADRQRILEEFLSVSPLTRDQVAWEPPSDAAAS